MARPDYIPHGVLALVILLTPILPTAGLQLLDNLVVRIALVFGLLYAITQGALLGLLALLAVGSLYLERNRRKVHQARQKFAELPDPEAAERPATVEEESEPQDTVPVIAFEEPSGDVTTYLPKSGMGSNDFASVAPTLNEKDPLPTVPLGAKSASLFKPFVM